MSGWFARRSERLLPLMAAAGLFLMTGCAGPAGKPGTPVAGVGPVRELNLLAMPSALNLNDKPGADGVAVKVFAVRQGGMKGVPIRSGWIEVLAYEGTFEDAPPTKPFHEWRLNPDQLARSEIKTLMGTGYYLVLDWSPHILHGNRATIIARYLSDSGAPVTSAPSYVAVTAL